MKQDELLQQIRQQLSNAELGSALDSLHQYGQQFAPKRLPDITTLRARFLNAQRQYEIKGVITKQEFDLVFSRTLDGIQQILAGNNLAEIEKLPLPGLAKNRRKYYLAGLLILTGFLIALIVYMRNDAGGPTNESADSLKTGPGIEKLSDNPQKTDRSSDRSGVSPSNQDKNPNPGIIQKPSRQADPGNAPLPAKPPVFFKVKIVLNAELSNAAIFVDDAPAVILRETPIIKTIRVQQKPDNAMHHFELKLNNQTVCSKDRLITQDDVQITMACKL